MFFKLWDEDRVSNKNPVGEHPNSIHLGFEPGTSACEARATTNTQTLLFYHDMVIGKSNLKISCLSSLRAHSDQDRQQGLRKYFMLSLKTVYLYFALYGAFHESCVSMSFFNKPLFLLTNFTRQKDISIFF